MENFEFMLKVSLQETPSTIPKKMELYSNTFHNFKKIGFTLKVSLKETFHNFYSQWKISNFEETHLSQFSKNEIILKVSLEETPSIIFKKIGFILKVFIS